MARYAARGSIEQAFADARQVLGVGEAHNRLAQAVPSDARSRSRRRGRTPGTGSLVHHQDRTLLRGHDDQAPTRRDRQPFSSPEPPTRQPPKKPEPYSQPGPPPKHDHSKPRNTSVQRPGRNNSLTTAVSLPARAHGAALAALQQTGHLLAESLPETVQVRADQTPDPQRDHHRTPVHRDGPRPSCGGSRAPFLPASRTPDRAPAHHTRPYHDSDPLSVIHDFLDRQGRRPEITVVTREVPFRIHRQRRQSQLITDYGTAPFATHPRVDPFVVRLGCNHVRVDHHLRCKIHSPRHGSTVTPSCRGCLRRTTPTAPVARRGHVNSSLTPETESMDRPSRNVERS